VAEGRDILTVYFLYETGGDNVHWGLGQHTKFLFFFYFFLMLVVAVKL